MPLHINEIRKIIIENVYCEDGEIKIKNQIKYDLYNLVLERDTKFIQELHQKLEYKPFEGEE